VYLHAKFRERSLEQSGLRFAGITAGAFTLLIDLEKRDEFTQSLTAPQAGVL